MSSFSKCLPWNPPSPNLETRPQNPHSGSQKVQKRSATWRFTKYLDEWWPESAWQLDSFFREAVAPQSLTGFPPLGLGKQWNESNPTSTTQGKARPSSKIQVVLCSEMMWVLSWSAVQLRREGNGTPLQYSCLENPMDRGAWWAAVHGVTRSRTQLSNFTFPFHFHALEKEMATHSSVLAWRIQGIEEPGGLPSLGLHRVRHDWSDLAAAAAAQLRKLKLSVILYKNLSKITAPMSA